MKNDFVLERKKNIYLSDSDILILDKYNINYLEFSNMKELIMYLEDYLNNIEYFEDLEDLSIKLSEYNYYFDYNK